MSRYPLGKHTSVFQAEMFALFENVTECMHRTFSGRQICIFTDSPATLRALLSSKLAWECHSRMQDLAEHNKKVVLSWIPGYMDHKRNERV